MTLIIDPPSVFAGLAAWTEFRVAMEELVAREPDNETARDWLVQARAEEERLSVEPAA